MTLSRWTFWKLALLAVPLALGAPPPTEAVQGGCAKGIIYVVDGATGKGELTDNLADQVNQAGLPLNVQPVYWSSFNEAIDFQSQYHFTVQGKQLAQRILHMRKNCPNQKIYLVGLGAGTTVVLKATEYLPPNSVTEIILMASAVSCNYDLRQALLASCEGIDSFCNPNDGILKCGILKYGTTDIGVRGAMNAAGLCGFHVIVHTPQDRALYAKLRQHSLNEGCDPTEGYGRKGYLRAYFLRTQVVSIFEASLIYNRPCPPYGPAPRHPTPSPAPQTPVPHFPTPRTPAPQHPPTPAPQVPAPRSPTPQPPPAPPQTPAPAPQLPVPPWPTPQTPTPQYPPTPAPQLPPPHGVGNMASSPIAR